MRKCTAASPPSTPLYRQPRADRNRRRETRECIPSSVCCVGVYACARTRSRSCMCVYACRRVRGARVPSRRNSGNARGVAPANRCDIAISIASVLPHFNHYSKTTRHRKEHGGKPTTRELVHLPMHLGRRKWLDGETREIVFIYLLFGTM